MALIVFIIIMAVLFLSACSTKKTTAQYIVSHDTLLIYKTDTAITERIAHHTDTIREREITYVTIERRDSTTPDTVRIETIRDYYHTATVKDTTAARSARTGTEKATAIQEKEKAVTKTKAPRYWEYVIFAAFLAVVWILINRVK